MDLPQADADQDALTQRPARFTYPSGSRPLEGYTIKRGVGRGGFGEVYFAVSDAGKEVALKLIRRNLDVELRGVTQCLNLKHQNLIALYDIRTDDTDDRWVVMEFVAGESLEDAIERHPEGMPEDLLVSWFAGVCKGVAYLHDHGIVHRDLKPANIFIDDGVVKIGDYGLSKFISCSRRSGQTESVGTVHYMAPEIANGRYGREIDTYALGVMLYEMLTGKVPFEGESVGEVLMKHLTAEADLASVSENYRGIVSSLLTKDPDARVKNVGELLEKLPEGVASGPARVVDPLNPDASAKTAPAAMDEEPILASLRAGWRHLEDKFRTNEWHPVLKAMAGVGIVFFMVMATPFSFGALFTLAFAYVIYRGVRLVVLQPGKPPIAQPASQASAPLKSTKRKTPAHLKRTARYPRRRHSVRQRLNEHVANKSTQERLTELLGGMLLAALVASLASLLVLPGAADGSAVELYVWAAVVTTLAAWAAMAPARMMEGRVEDQAPLRFTQMVLGAIVGVVAWALADLLMLRLPVNNQLEFGMNPSDTIISGSIGQGFGYLDSSLAAGSVAVPLSLFAGYFAGLFLLYGFWKGADSIRSSRVSVWSVAWCVLVAWFLHIFWWFPQPLGAVLAGAIAFTVQFSSPWMPPSQRRKLVEAAEL
ncbi:MAG: serine/threonine-protein kinase [Planctomycetota bacterium]